MLRIETSGSWREMGRALAEAFPDQLREFIELFTPDVARGQVPRIAPTLREMTRQYAPELLDETAGMAEVLALPPGGLLCYRMFVDANALKPRQGCSVFMLDDAPEGSLLARTCDIEPETHANQICQIRRPDDGMATITLTYVGLVSSIGMNEAGLGLAGASARPAEEGTASGPGMNIVAFSALQRCQRVHEAEDLLCAQPLVGKGSVQLLADAEGDCRLLEFVHGRRAVSVPRPACRSWDAATNFHPSGRTPSEPRLGVDYNSYARYGRIVHQLMTNPRAHSVAGAQALLGDISQPGRYIPEGAFPLQTAYASVFELRTRVCHLCAGNPLREPFEAIAL